MKKGGVLCQEAMVQGRAVKASEQAVVAVKVRVEVEWAARLPQGQAEIAFVRNVEQQLPILLDSLAML